MADYVDEYGDPTEPLFEGERRLRVNPRIAELEAALSAVTKERDEVKEDALELSRLSASWKAEADGLARQVREATAQEAVSYVDLLERFAEVAHDSWAGWLDWMIEKWDQPQSVDGTFRQRWIRQAKTPYAELTEAEKENDRIEARKYTGAILGAALAMPSPDAGALLAVVTAAVALHDAFRVAKELRDPEGRPSEEQLQAEADNWDACYEDFNRAVDALPGVFREVTR